MVIRYEEKWEKMRKNRVRNFKKQKKTATLIYPTKY